MAALLICLYLRTVAAWWDVTITALQSGDVTQPQPNDSLISAPYECKSTGAKKFSLPPEAVTIYNTDTSRVVDAVAYYRQPDCKLAPDFLIVLNHMNPMGVNVVDLTYLSSEITAIGAPLSFREVNLNEFAGIIYMKTGTAPVAGSIYRWDKLGILKERVNVPGVLWNFQLEEYATPEELGMIQNDVNETPTVLKSVTERLLEKVPDRGKRLLDYLGIGKELGLNKKEERRQRKELMAISTVQIIDPLSEFKTPTDRAQVNSALTASTKESWSPRKKPTKKVSTLPNLHQIGVNPLMVKENPINIPNPQEIANRPINYEMLAAQCLLSGDPLLWCQRYLAVQQYHERLAKAAFDIMQSTRLVEDISKGALPKLGELIARQRFYEYPDLKHLLNPVPPKLKPVIEDKGTQVEPSDLKIEEGIPAVAPLSDMISLNFDEDFAAADLDWPFPPGWEAPNRDSRRYENNDPFLQDADDGDFDFETFLYNTKKKFKSNNGGSRE
ncbi:hypothetical protein TWF694_011478 [Orbilia ellipsospora]|uniref:Uncharacterized protein n=1 Tax=Orbilia ellipsospora TaxID=2528407 RepID=A0AAV9X6L0_9PEZI